MTTDNWKPVVTVGSWTNGSYSRNYSITWHRYVPAGTQLYTAPQPMEREPLTDLEIESATGAKIGTPLFLVAKGIVQATESAHGIKGGQHGTD